MYISTDDKWDSDDTLIMLECILKKCEEKLNDINTECVVILDSNKGDIPFMYQMTIIRWLLDKSHTIEQKIKFSIIYCTNNNHKTWIDAMFKFYKPMKPVFIIQTKNELLLKLKEYIKKEFLEL